jgi:hypothetical protein
MIHSRKMIGVLGVTALMLTPFSPTSAIFDHGAAYAGNGKGGGGGNGNSGGGGGGGNKGSDRSSSAGGKPGGDGKQVAAAPKPSNARPKTQVKTVEGETVTFASRDLGNMNGAMNANVKAVLAHIRNGNTNGPVGAVAALVSADAKLGDLDAQEVLDRAEVWETFDAAVSSALNGTDYVTITDYVEAKEAAGAATLQYQDDLAAWNESDGAYQAALTALQNGEITEDQLPPEPGLAPTAPDMFVTIDAAEALIGSEPAAERPLDADIASAKGVTDAESALLALWNKNPDSAEDLTTEEQALLDSFRARFSDADLEAIAKASGS